MRYHTYEVSPFDHPANVSKVLLAASHRQQSLCHNLPLTRNEAVHFCAVQALKASLGDDRIRWAYLPYSMHMAGPREAIQHMLIRKVCGSRLPLQLQDPHFRD